MSTQGILISGNTNETPKTCSSSRLRSVSAAPSSSSPQHQSSDSARNRSLSKATGNSPRKIIRLPVISPRLMASRKQEHSIKRNSGEPGNLFRKPEDHSGEPVPSDIIPSINYTPTPQPQPKHFKRFATNQPRQPPATRDLKHVHRNRHSAATPIFPDPPIKPEKFSGNDKLSYKIWMKERAKFEKWESSKTLYSIKLAEGNYSACQKIIDRVNLEMEELSNAIKEDEYRRIFPEEPVKPAEYCPSNVKEAKVWYQQKILYEAWQNAFKLFQEHAAKGDSNACQKLIDIIQLTIHNPLYKANEMSISQPSSVRRHQFEHISSKPLSDDFQIPVSRPQVKFAPNPTVSITSNQPTSVATTLPKTTRPKLKPPASWTKTKPVTEEKATSKVSETSTKHNPNGHWSLQVTENGSENKENLEALENDIGNNGGDLLNKIDLNSPALTTI